MKMFTFKNPQPKASASKINLDQKEDFKIEDVPIYTMKKDLENPLTSEEESASAVSPAKPIAKEMEKLSEKQKSSPFLTQMDVNSSTPSPSHSESSADPSATAKILSVNKAPAPSPIITNKEAGPSNVKATEGTNWGRIILTAITIFILLIAGVGGYYFWTTRQETPATPEEILDPETELIREETEEQEEVVVEDSEPAKPNYFVLDITDLDETKLKVAVDKYFSETMNTSTTSMLKEFILVDPQNNPIKFKDFADSAGIALSANLISNLKDTFSLFIYAEDKVPKIGLSIDSKNDVEIKRLLLEEEGVLAQELDPIFLLSTYTTEKTFASSNYGGSEIRYQNLISPEKLSVDYTLYKNKLLIGTTKLTLRYMLDFLGTQQTKLP